MLQLRSGLQTRTAQVAQRWMWTSLPLLAVCEQTQRVSSSHSCSSSPEFIPHIVPHQDCAPLEVNHPQQCRAIHSHLLLNMELIFHSGTHHTESSFGKEKLSIFKEAFHIDQKILIQWDTTGIKIKLKRPVIQNQFSSVLSTAGSTPFVLYF